MGPGVLFPQPPSRDRPSFPIAFGAKTAADLASKPRPQHPSPIRGCDTGQRDPLPPQQQQCTIRALDARKPFNAPPLSIPSDVSSNPGDDASSCSSPASFPVLPLFSHHSTAKPPSAPRPPARSPRPSLPRPRSPCPIDFSSLSNSPRHSPGTTFGRPARPATPPEGSAPRTAAYPCDEESTRLTDNAAAPAPVKAAQQAQWFILPVQRPEVVRAASQTSRCASPDTPLGFVTSPNAASSPSSQPSRGAKPRSSLSSLPPSSPPASIAADSAAGGFAAENCDFGGDCNVESNRLVITGNSSRSVSSAGSVECGEPYVSTLADTAAMIGAKPATESARRSSESDFAAKRAAADAARPAAMGFRSVSLNGRAEGRTVMGAAAQAERELSRHRCATVPSRNMPHGAGLVAAWGGIASRAPPLAASRQEEAEENAAEKAEEVEREGDRLVVLDDVSDAVSCGVSSVSDEWGGSHGGETGLDDRGGDAGEEEGGSESDWASESTMCLNLESVEQLCAQMEFQKKTIEAIQIVADGSRASGDGSRASGDGGRASGDGGRASGDGGRASGDGGRASGDGSRASGDGGRASGDGGRASGDGGRASGDGSRASGDGSRASGDGSRASGDGGRASGDGSRASGDGSRASGDGSRASGDGSRASGDGGRASGDGGRASGDGGRASGDGGRASGDGGRASGDGGRASGDGGRASGDGGRASGDGGRASGDGGRASGDGGRASGDGGRASGDGGRASGDGSRASGDGGRASGDGGRASVFTSPPASCSSRGDY
ncbi:unnamed protein product [Closterium sp. Yama58-4]|nr:unnamed protein product [Closterium sp. Yama58-4]